MKLLTLQQIQKALTSVKALISEILTDTVEALTELETKIPSRVSELENDSGYLTSSTANTTYELKQSKNVMSLVGSDGKTTTATITPDDVGAVKKSGDTMTGALTATSFNGNWNGRNYANTVGCVPVQISYSSTATNNEGTTFHDYMTQVNAKLKEYGVSSDSHCIITKAKHWNWTGIGTGSHWGMDIAYGQNNSNGNKWNDGTILSIISGRFTLLTYQYDTSSKQFKITGSQNFSSEIADLKKSVKTVVYQSAEPTSGLVNNLVWIG